MSPCDWSRFRSRIASLWLQARHGILVASVTVRARSAKTLTRCFLWVRNGASAGYTLSPAFHLTCVCNACSCRGTSISAGKELLMNRRCLLLIVPSGPLVDLGLIQLIGLLYKVSILSCHSRRSTLGLESTVVDLIR